MRIDRNEQLVGRDAGRAAFKRVMDCRHPGARASMALISSRRVSAASAAAAANAAVWRNRAPRSAPPCWSMAPVWSMAL
jgi:hypothetical protein